MRKKRAGKTAGLRISEIANAEHSALLKTSQPSSFKSRLNASAEHKRPFKIKDRYSDRVLFETEAETLKDAVEEAVELQVKLTCADLRNADLGGAYLAQAELSCADLSGASLFGAVLHRAYLTGTHLCNADLRYANFRYATLKKAVLRNSELICTGFFGSNLVQADFRSSNLEGADLSSANLTSTSFDLRPTVPAEGPVMVYKGACDIQGNLVIAKLLIPEDAKRMTPLFGRVVRAEYVKVLALEGDVSIARCRFWPDRIYAVDEKVCTIGYDNSSDVQVGIAHDGINLYFTREEAVCWQRYWYPPLEPVAEYWKSATYKGWIEGMKYINQPDNPCDRWQAEKLLSARRANLMNQWDEETNSGMSQASI